MNTNHETGPTGEAAFEMNDDLRQGIQLFRSAMHQIAERVTARPVTIDWLAPARRRQRSAQRRMALAWTCAAALCLAVLPVSMQKNSTQHPQATPAMAAAASPSTVSDTALLDQVDTAIAEPVPTSLAPLTEMDNWNTDTSTGTSLQSTEKTNVTQ